MGAVECTACCSTRDRENTEPELNGKTPTPRSTRGLYNTKIRPSPRASPSTEVEIQAPVQKAVRRVLGDMTNMTTSQEKTAEPEKLPSKGSAQHAAGLCKRCCFFPRNRCTNGYDCEFCHFEHEKRTHRKRKSKKAENALEVDIDAAGLELSTMPPSPDSLAGDSAPFSWVNTPEAAGGPAPVFVQSCLGTVPVATADQTSAVPVYTATPAFATNAIWCDDDANALHLSQKRLGEYISTHGERYQIPQDWKQHNQQPRANRLLPDYGSILPETAPLGLHHWQDVGGEVSQWQGQERQVAAQWQDPGCSWPVVDAGWEYSMSSQQQPWEWNMQADETYTGMWTGSVQDENMNWNAQNVQQCGGTPLLPPLTMNNSSDTHMPEYMPAISVNSTPASKPAAPALPESWEVVAESQPPPLSSDLPAAAVAEPPGLDEGASNSPGSIGVLTP